MIPWLNIGIPTIIYLFLWGENFNTYRHYQLLIYGQVATEKISGQDVIYKYSDSPRMCIRALMGQGFRRITGQPFQESTATFLLQL
jgi:hypothetical protein